MSSNQCIITSKEPIHNPYHQSNDKESIPFPAIFRICLKPAYNETFLRQAGYVTAWDLFTGSQMTQCKIEFTYQPQKPPNFKVVLEW